jgi:hypothetical protein
MFRRSMPPLIAVLAVAASLVVTASQALAAEGPVWKILAVSNPTNFKPGDQSGIDAIVVTATNVGGAYAGCTQAQSEVEQNEETEGTKALKTAGCTSGSPLRGPIAITDSLPVGLTVVEIVGGNPYKNPYGELHPAQGGIGGYGEQEGPPYGLKCALSATAPSCSTSERIDPGDTLIVTIRVRVNSDTEGSGEVNRASVSGGGATSASTSDPVTISSSSPPFGVASGGLLAAASTSQAGAHPNVTTAFFLNTINPAGEIYSHAHARGTEAWGLVESEPVDAPKDVGFDLPPGLVGTTVGMARCTMAEVINESNCPRDTMVGAAILIVETPSIARAVFTVPVFNIAPAPGEPAAFAFNAIFFPARLDTSVLSDGDYGVRVSASNITAGAADYASFITIWGVPSEHNGPGPDAADENLEGHRFLKGHNEGKPQYSFGGPGTEEKEECGGANGCEIKERANATRVPLLTNPSQCSTRLEGSLETDSWEGLGPGVFANAGTSLGTDTGCGELSFKPGVSMVPDTLEAGAPAGYSFDLNVPQNTEAEGLATPDVKRTSVTLPLGTVISPSAADGLGDCTNEQFELHSGVPGHCPRDSQVGTVRVKTPALEERLTGDVFLGAPECDPCTPQDAADGRMIRLFVQFVGEGEDGVLVKLEGTGQVNQQTGQITTTFNETPQLPFSEFQLTLQGGERAALANPRTCGEVTTTADLTPWSTPYTPDATPESRFSIDENCFGPQFAPSFSAGTTSNQAGGFSPFTLSFGRADADEFLNGVQITMPPGLLGMLSKVKLCEEPQANAGTCAPESQIGEVSVETGPGADPFLVTGGKVYITGPYRGAPYGLSIVVPAKAGPYTLAGTTGNGTVVNRSSISVNPETSALTVTSDPLPTELDGIPLQLRLVNVTVGTNNGFTFNPTSCEKLAIAGTLTSTEAASAHESSSYQVTNCAALKFKPSFTATTSAHTSKKDGASLLFKVAYPSGAQGSQSWLRQMKFDIPKQLPARLTTLQKACFAATFETDPASCPSSSVIGEAVVHTPVLAVPLKGPVYFVSHGSAKFPEVVIVLQGGGVTLDLHGETFISKAGVTSATFRTVPDAPFETAEVFIPTGPYSEFTALGSLCTQKLVMPIAFTAQNGAVLRQNTKIGVTACPKARLATKANKASHARKSSHDAGRKS